MPGRIECEYDNAILYIESKKDINGDTLIEGVVLYSGDKTLELDLPNFDFIVTDDNKVHVVNAIRKMRLPTPEEYADAIQTAAEERRKKREQKQREKTEKEKGEKEISKQWSEELKNLIQSQPTNHPQILDHFLKVIRQKIEIDSGDIFNLLYETFPKNKFSTTRNPNRQENLDDKEQSAGDLIGYMMYNLKNHNVMAYDTREQIESRQKKRVTGADIDGLKDQL